YAVLIVCLCDADKSKTTGILSNFSYCQKLEVSINNVTINWYPDQSFGSPVKDADWAGLLKLTKADKCP
ncbi:MAG TPA: hypothetical protein VFE24_10120, partial [Pirellulales bacterium]|nr:hypothetical protein [Pirellulales bacterium]